MADRLRFQPFGDRARRAMLRRAWDDLQVFRAEGVPEHVVAKMGRMVATTAFIAESFDEVCAERDLAVAAVAEAEDYISQLEVAAGVAPRERSGS